MTSIDWSEIEVIENALSNYECDLTHQEYILPPATYKELIRILNSANEAIEKIRLKKNEEEIEA